MKKRFLTLLLSATMLFSAVGFTACTNGEMEAKIAELEAQITELQEQNQDLQADITDQQTQITTQQEQIEALEQENEELQANIAEQQEQIEALEQENQELQTTITNQQEQITELQQEKQKLEDQLALPFIKELEADGMIELQAWGELFGDNIIVANLEEEDVVFECKAKKGYIWPVDNTFYWHVQNPFMSHWGGLTYYQDYISVVAKTENNILGYGVIEVLLSEDSATATVIKSVKFPMVDGEYQRITQNQVDMLIENVERG